MNKKSISNYEDICKSLLEILKDLCIILELKDLEERFCHIPNSINKITLPSGMILQKTTYKNLRHFQIWQDQFSRRFIKYKELLESECQKILTETTKSAKRNKKRKYSS